MTTLPSPIGAPLPATALPLTPPPRRRWPRRVATCLVVVALAGGGIAVFKARQGGPSGYRTAEVTTQDLAHHLSSVGSVEPVKQASVAFPVAGTVSSVAVKVGQTVTAGQALATLDPTSLQMTVRQQQAELDQAELTLQKALDGEAVSLPSSSGSSGPTQAASYTGSDDATAVLLAANVSPTTSSTTPTSTPTSTPSSTPPSTPTGAAPGTTPAKGTTSGPTDAQIKAAQQAVLDAQKTVDAKLGQAQQALDSATQVCAAATSGTGSGSTTTTTPSTSPPSTSPSSSTPTTSTSTTPPTTAPATTTTTAATTTTTAATTTTSAAPATTVALRTGAAQATLMAAYTSGSSSSITACQQQLDVVLTAQQDVADAQTALSKAATTLDGLLTARAAAATTPSDSVPNGQRGQGGTGSGGAKPSGGSFSGGGGSGGSGGSSRTSSASASPSSADLIAYQKSVDAAQASLLVAQQALKQATIASPIDGRVIAVNLAAGDSVTAGSTTATVVVAGSGGYEVTTTVAVADLPKIEMNQQAQITPDGASTPLTGKVVAIGVAATSSTGATTYPVTVSLPANASVLDGSVASVALVTSSAENVLAVPSSAVHTTGTRHTVQVLENGKVQDVTVQVGTVGDTWTEIVNGLSAGQQVVLADLSAALPTSATNSSNGTNNNRTGNGNVFVPPNFNGGGFGGARRGG